MDSESGSTNGGVSRRETLRRGFLASSAVALGLPAVARTGSAGPPCDLVVDDDGGSDADYTTVGAAVENADSGDVICVRPGTYEESDVGIDKPLTLTGDPGRGNEAGPGSDAPVLDGTGFTNSDAFVLEDGVSDVTIEGFEIRNYEGPGGGRGNAVMAWNVSTSDVTVESNHMHDNAWNAVLVGSDGSTTHSGWSLRSNVAADNGVYQLELTNCDGSSIHGNEVRGGYTGLLVTTQNHAEDGEDLSTGSISVESNEVTGAFGTYGLWALAWTTASEASATLANVNCVGNHIEDDDNCAVVWAIGGDDSVENAKFVRNDFACADGGEPTGVWLPNPQTADTKIVNNDFADCIDPDVLDDGSDTKQPPVPENPS
jgi:hypothetical protein